MKTLREVTALVVMLTAAWTVGGQTNYDRVLIPIAVVKAPGAKNSLWTSETLIHNPNPFFVDMHIPQTNCAFCGPPPLNPHSTFSLGVTNEPADHPGIVAYLHQPSENVWFYSRVFDESQASTFGTEIPIVRESQFYDRSFFLEGLTTNVGFRVNLRIYDLEGKSDEVVTIRARGTFIENEFGSIDISLSPSPTPPVIGGTTKPSYAQIQDLPAVISGILDEKGTPRVERYTLEITPKTAGLKIWAFATVTDNATQHVTTITPR